MHTHLHAVTIIQLQFASGMEQISVCARCMEKCIIKNVMWQSTENKNALKMKVLSTMHYWFILNTFWFVSFPRGRCERLQWCFSVCQYEEEEGKTVFVELSADKLTHQT